MSGNGVEVGDYFIWDAECPKCNSLFRWNNHDIPDNGVFCPVCRERNYVLLGVINFEKELINIPFTTA